MSWKPAYSDVEVRAAVEGSLSLSAALRLLGMRPAGGNFRTLNRLIAHYEISTEHFDPNWVLRGTRIRHQIPLPEILVEGSAYNRGRLKSRLFNAGLKQRVCELCGQGEVWHGHGMALILDHINGVGNDNRLKTCGSSAPTVRRRWRLTAGVRTGSR